MEEKEPYATQEEFNKRIVRYHDVPIIEFTPGLKGQIVSAEKMTVNFVTADPSSQVDIHQHESEQITIIMEGACNAMVDGKLYPLKKGDVAILPSNIEHGVYFTDSGCRIIEVFSPPRQDLLAKLEAVKRDLKK